MSTVRILLELKEARFGKREPISVEPGDLVKDAVDAMWFHNVRSVLVMAEGKLVGILTVWDCIGKLEREHRLAAWTLVREIMTPVPIETVTPATPLDEAVARFGKHRHLPVLDREGNVLDVISDMDLIYALQTHGWNIEDVARGAMMPRT